MLRFADGSPPKLKFPRNSSKACSSQDGQAFSFLGDSGRIMTYEEAQEVFACMERFTQRQAFRTKVLTAARTDEGKGSWTIAPGC